MTNQRKDSTDHIKLTILCFKFELTKQLHTFQHSYIIFV